MKKKQIECEVEIEMPLGRKKSKRSEKERKLHESYEGKETNSFKDAEYHLGMAKKHHKQAMHHNEMAKKMEKSDDSKETSSERKKVAKVMREYKKGELPMGKSKKMVHNPKQAIAIAMSEAGIKRKKKKKK